MVDLHSHVLPGVDDGAPDLTVALEMLRRAAADGIRVAVLTPHLAPEDGPLQESRHREVFAELTAAVSQAGIPVALHLGAEIGFRFGLVEVARWPSGTLAGRGYALVDLPPGPLSPGLEQGFFELRAAGFRPILAHPERSRALAGTPERLARLRHLGVLLQVDAGSLTGQFGERARRTAEALVRRNWVELVASDAHDLSRRVMELGPAAARLQALAGVETTRRLLVDNPGRVVRGEPVEVAPGIPVRPGWRDLLRRLLPGRRGG
ncbi:MAG: CpsB/CapC family capsule biosynthesis tyrosine phosphatase [Candidatus Latescibacterota bacterium]|jgi:protein-tyrosine phosphatase